MKQKSAISKINKNGILLVFPINNKKEPHSLWHELYPRTKMKWEWDDESDNRVADMWYLMKRLSDCKEVVYSKWYQGRATFFSRELFTAMLCVLQNQGELTLGISRTSKTLLETLEGDSPLSTKDLKKMTDLQGKLNETEYQRGLKALFSRFLVIAFGEVDDGAFPSLAIGATKNLYEDLWVAAQELKLIEAQKTVDQFMPKDSAFRKFFDKVSREINTFNS